MVHEVRVTLKQLRSLLLHRCLKTLCIRWRHSIPCLGFSPGEGGREGGFSERRRKEGRKEGGREGGRESLVSWGRGRREEERREGGREGGRGGEGVYSIPVEVVDGVAPVIFNVPTETRETHPNIQPRHLMHYIMSILLHHYNVYMLYVQHMLSWLYVFACKLLKITACTCILFYGHPPKKFHTQRVWANASHGSPSFQRYQH